MSMRGVWIVGCLVAGAACSGSTGPAPGARDPGAAPDPDPDPGDSGEPAADEAETVQATPLDGPHASIEAYCATALERARSGTDVPDYEDTSRCVAADPDGEHAAFAGVREFVAPFEVVTHVEWSYDSCVLAVQTPDGWFFGTPFQCGWTDSGSRVDAELSTLEVRDVLEGGDPELLAGYQVTEMFEGDETEQDTLRVCGVGPSGTPSCADFAEPPDAVRFDGADVVAGGAAHRIVFP